MPRWSAEEINALRELTAAGHGDARIAGELRRRFGRHRTVDAVLSKRTALGLRSQAAAPRWTPAELQTIRRMARVGASAADIADELADVHGTERTPAAVTTTVYRFRLPGPGRGRRPDPARESRILALLSAGRPVIQIAEVMETSQAAVRKTIRRLVRRGLVERTGGNTRTVRYLPTLKWSRDMGGDE